MSPIDHLQDQVWERPSDYGGFSPDGDYVIMTRTRDSGALENSNYEAAFKVLREVAEKFDPPDPDSNDDRNTSYDGWTPRAHDWVYDFRAGHWVCGWVEYLLVRDDAPDEILQAAGELIASLGDYPVLDESDYSERENEEVNEAWRWLSIRERLRLLADCNAECSMFVVRRDECPNDYRVFDALRGY